MKIRDLIIEAFNVELDEDLTSQDQLRVEQGLNRFYSPFNLKLRFSPHMFTRMDTRTLTQDSKVVAEMLQYMVMELIGKTRREIDEFKVQSQKITLRVGDEMNKGLIYGVVNIGDRTFSLTEKGPAKISLIFSIAYPEGNDGPVTNPKTKFPYRGTMIINFNTMLPSAKRTNQDDRGLNQWPYTPSIDVSQYGVFNEYLKNHNLSKRSENPNDLYYGHFRKLKPQSFSRLEHAIKNVLEKVITLKKSSYEEQKKLESARRSNNKSDIEELTKRSQTANMLLQFAIKAKNDLYKFLQNNVNLKIGDKDYSFSSDNIQNFDKIIADCTKPGSNLKLGDFDLTNDIPESLVNLQLKFETLTDNIKTTDDEETRKKLSRELKKWKEVSGYNKIMNSLVIGTENFANSVASSGSKAVNNAQAKLASSPAPASTQQNDSQRNAAKQKLEQLEMNDREYYEEAISEIKRLQDEISQYQSTASFISDTTQKNQMMNYVNKQKEEMQYWNNIKSLFNLAYPELKESQINLTDLLYLSGLK
jgi:hypothetical protein